jgi:thiol:disulfide interchange protein
MRARRDWLRSALALWTSACVPISADAPEPPEEAEQEADWNDGAIGWTAYEAGIARGKAERRPILLVFYTDWCPHCHNYSRVFHDPEVVRLARGFVMVRVERDGQRRLSETYDLDGEYIPRTFFLTPTGEVRTDLHGNNPAFRYFLDEHEPHELIQLMGRALGSTRAAGDTGAD